MRNGFTLIELLVVVLIIGILAAVALPQYTQTVEKSRAAEALTNLKALHNAENIYFLENNAYTTNLTELAVEISDTKNFKFGLEIDPTWTMVYAGRDVSDQRYYRLVYFFNNTVYPQYAGRFICHASETNKKGMKVCATMGKNKAAYAHIAGDYAFFID